MPDVDGHVITSALGGNSPSQITALFLSCKTATNLESRVSFPLFYNIDKVKTYFVDAFTNERFKGNPAAVCLTDQSLPEAYMQQVATEIGFSETAFVMHLSDHEYAIRFFTPKKEIPLCGHATLASSKILFDTHNIDKIIFVNVEGIKLPVEKSGDKMVMQFPVYTTVPVSVPGEMLEALGIEAIVNARYSEKNRIILIELVHAEVLQNMKPDFQALVKSCSGINGVLVTSASSGLEYDFLYRYFWPWAGTNEDPVTGGVQTFLTRYWAEKLNKTRLHAFQASARTGNMVTELKDDRVFIYGEAVLVLEGRWAGDF
jgi:PhzF family phenazine biosynthesis protein